MIPAVGLLARRHPYLYVLDLTRNELDLTGNPRLAGPDDDAEAVAHTRGDFAKDEAAVSFGQRRQHEWRPTIHWHQPQGRATRRHRRRSEQTPFKSGRPLKLDFDGLWSAGLNRLRRVPGAQTVTSTAAAGAGTSNRPATSVLNVAFVIPLRWRDTT